MLYNPQLKATPPEAGKLQKQSVHFEYYKVYKQVQHFIERKKVK